jgi:hypothetical protein
VASCRDAGETVDAVCLAATAHAAMASMNGSADGTFRIMSAMATLESPSLLHRGGFGGVTTSVIA